jgi:hypothetical protein
MGGPPALTFRDAGDSGIGKSKPSPFENREGAGTRKFQFKGWPTRLIIKAGENFNWNNMKNNVQKYCSSNPGAK